MQTATVISSGSQSCLLRQIQSQFDTLSNNMVSIRLTRRLMKKSSITGSWSDSLYRPSVSSYGAGLKSNQKVTPIISVPLLDPWAYPAKPVIAVVHGLYNWEGLSIAPIPLQPAQYLLILSSLGRRLQGQLQFDSSKACTKSLWCLQQCGLTFKVYVHLFICFLNSNKMVIGKRY